MTFNQLYSLLDMDNEDDDNVGSETSIVGVFWKWNKKHKEIVEEIINSYLIMN